MSHFLFENKKIVELSEKYMEKPFNYHILSIYINFSKRTVFDSVVAVVSESKFL